MTEQLIQGRIKQWLKDQGAFSVKTVLSSAAGVPDLLVCYKGLFIGLEVKRPGNRATALQEAKGRMIQKAGGIFSVVTSLNDVKLIIGNIDEQFRSKSEGVHKSGGPAGAVTEPGGHI